MLKKVFGCLILLTVLCALALPAFAYAAPTTAEIKVTIEGGGTATIIPQVNSPSAEESSLELADKEEGFFIINFDEAGDYRYTITTRDEETFSPKYYTADIAVRVAEDNTLYAVTVLIADGAEDKAAAAIFVTKSAQETTTPPEETTTPGGGDNPGGNNPGGNTPGNNRSSQPQTGDETHLDSYLLLAIAASAGLLMLAAVYMHNVNKSIGYGKR